MKLRDIAQEPSSGMVAERNLPKSDTVGRRRMKPFSIENDIRAELDAHFDDAEAAYVREGFAPREAQMRALTEFGDRASVETQLAEIGVDRAIPAAVLLGSAAYVIVLAVLTAAEVAGVGKGTPLDILFLWWLQAGVGIAAYLPVVWLTQYFGIRSVRTPATAFAFSFLVALSMTLVVDLNDFETSLHLAPLILALSLVAFRFWRRVPLTLQRASLMAVHAFAMFAAFANVRVFGFLRPESCLYLRPSGVPLVGELASCRQVTFPDPALVALIGVTLVFVALFSSSLAAFLRGAATAVGRKTAVLAFSIALPLAPLMTGNLNAYGQWDVLEWEPAIYAAYQDILGRNPQDKDIAFYAQTRSYLHMNRIRKVLAASKERRLVIDNVYTAAVGRPATDAEMAYHVDHRTPVDAIRDEARKGIVR